MASIFTSEMPDIAAVVGEIFHDNTLVFALPFAFQNIFHCAAGQTTTSLSNKRRYPTLFKTGPTIDQQV